MSQPFIIQLDAQPVLDALNRLQAAGQALSPVLRAIGEDMVERSKQRFVTGTAPDGTRWQANAQATIEAFVAAKGGIGETGKINARGQVAAMNKRPLHGHSGDLAKQIFSQVTHDSLTVYTSPLYAAIQQLGGMAGRGKRVAIPARPFLPLTASRQLDPQEQQQVLDALNAHLAKSLTA